MTRKLVLIAACAALFLAVVAIVALRRDVAVATYVFSKSTTLREQALRDTTEALRSRAEHFEATDLVDSSIRVDYTNARAQIYFAGRKPVELNVLSSGPHGDYDIVLVSKEDDQLPHWVEELLNNFDTRHIPETLWVKTDIHYLDDEGEYYQVLKLEYDRSTLQYSRNTPTRLYRIVKSWADRWLFEIEVFKNKHLLPQPTEDTHEEQIPKISLVPGLNELNETTLNVYVGSSKVNFLSDKIDSVRKLLGNEQTDKPFGPGEGTRYYNMLASGGIGFLYEIHDGSLSRIIIESTAFPIEGGGKIGDSRATILSKYPEGLRRKYKGPPETEGYLFLEMDSSGNFGVGFEFLFGKDDRVQTITVSWHAFSQ